MDKAPDAYRTISEVADDLDLPQHVLRFWETRFAQIRPLKRGGGRRYYRPEDIDLLKGIRHLLYGEGYTIRGVQRIIKESGVKAIQAIGRGEGAAALPKPKGPDIIEPAAEPSGGGLRASLKGLFGGAGQSAREPAPAERDPDRDVAAPALGADNYGQRPFAARQEPAFAPASPVARDRTEPPPRALPADHAAYARNADDVVSDDLDEDDAPLDLPPALTVTAPPARPAPVEPVIRPAPAAVQAPPRAADMLPSRAAEILPSQARAPVQPSLAADDVRRLQAALYELLECRKRLDQAFEAR